MWLKLVKEKRKNEKRKLTVKNLITAKNGTKGQYYLPCPSRCYGITKTTVPTELADWLLSKLEKWMAHNNRVNILIKKATSHNAPYAKKPR